MKELITSNIHGVTSIVIKQEQRLIPGCESYITQINFHTEGAIYEVTAFGTKEAVKVEREEI